MTDLANEVPIFKKKLLISICTALYKIKGDTTVIIIQLERPYS